MSESNTSLPAAARASRLAEYMKDFHERLDVGAQSDGHIPPAFDLAKFCGWEPDPAESDIVIFDDPINHD